MFRDEARRHSIVLPSSAADWRQRGMFLSWPGKSPSTSTVAPMEKSGVPLLGLMQDSRKYFDYHHTAADTLDKVVPQELRENAAAMAVMGYALANLAEPLPR